MKDIGLVLEGGGMRGIYTAGVLDFFMDKNFYLPYVIGVSAGACQGVSYVSRQRGRGKNAILNHIENPRYISKRNLVFKRSIMDMDFLFDEIPNKYELFDYDTFFENEQKCILVGTSCKTGQALYFDAKKDKSKQFVLDTCRASSSLPFVTPIVDVRGEPVLDGGIADSIPIKKAIADGNKKNIIVLTRGREYRKKPSNTAFISKKVYKNYPKLQETISSRYRVYNETLDYIESLEEQGEVFVIRPRRKVKIDRMERNKSKLADFYKTGYEDAHDIWADLSDWMSKIK